MTIPLTLAPDIERVLEANPRAFARFTTLPASHVREYLKWIDEAKKEATRKSRIEKMIQMLEREQEGS